MRFINNKNLPLFIIAFISTILIVIWFREGNIYGTGESGLPFYDFSIQYNINKDAWAYYALGHPINIGSAATPSYWLFNKLQNLGIPVIFLQAIFFWIILVISGLSVYKITKEVSPDIKGSHGLLAVLFYWFNPFSLVNVWNRFLNNFFVFYALLPLVAYFMIKGLKSKNYSYAIIIGLVSAGLAYALTSIAFTLLLWGVLLYIGFFYLFTHRHERLFTIKFSILTLVFWIFINFWWISQVFSYLQLGSFSAVVNTSFKSDTNYNTFSLISQKLGILTYIFRLKHVDFFNDVEHISWIGIYLFPLITFLEFLIAGIFLLPVVVKKRNSYVTMFAGLLFVSIFFAKGNNPPLGEIFDKAFASFSFLQIFRNPFEKIGFILSFSAAILFAAGCWEIEKIIGIKRKIITRSVIGFFLIVIWGFPFWTRYVFTAAEAPTNNPNIGFQVKVPEIYREISKWLKLQQDNYRIIVLPIGSEGITYAWEKGYSGVELSNQLLPKTSISFNTNIPFYDDISKALGRLIATREGLPKIMDILNSKYIIVREDIDWRARKMRDPNYINRRLEDIASSSGLQKIKEADRLTFWQDTAWIDRSIYLTNNLVESKPISLMEDILNVETDKGAALYNNQISSDDELTKYEIIHPSFKFGIGEKNVESSIILRDDIVFPAVNILPSSFLYPLIQVKERLETTRINDQNYKIIKRVSLLGKRLVEADKEAASHNFQGIVKALNGYERQLKELSSYHLEDNPTNFEKIIVQEDLYTLFSQHSELLEHIMNTLPFDQKERLVKTQNVLKSFLIAKGVEPLYGYLERPDYPLASRTIYQFVVDKEGDYELLLNIPNWNNYFKRSFSEPILLQVDDSFIARKGELKKNGLVSFGLFRLASGRHEIGLNSSEPTNLVDVPAEFSLMVSHGVLEKVFPVTNFDPYSTYILNMNYLIEKGSGVLVDIEGNNDRIKKGKIQPQFSKNLGPDGYNYEQKRYTTYYTPTSTSDTADLIFSVFPWNNCRDIYRTNKMNRCNDEIFRQPYDRDTEVKINNVSLVKVMTEVPFLILERSKYKVNKLPQISFSKENNSKYSVQITNATDKFALILSELYDPAWIITDQNNVRIDTNHFLANGYANGWILDKKGDYNLVIKFLPQDLLDKSRTISFVAVFIGFIAVGFLFYIKVKNEN